METGLWLVVNIRVWMWMELRLLLLCKLRNCKLGIGAGWKHPMDGGRCREVRGAGVEATQAVLLLLLVMMMMVMYGEQRLLLGKLLIVLEEGIPSAVAGRWVRSEQMGRDCMRVLSVRSYVSSRWKSSIYMSRCISQAMYLRLQPEAVWIVCTRRREERYWPWLRRGGGLELMVSLISRVPRVWPFGMGMMEGWIIKLCSRTAFQRR